MAINQNLITVETKYFQPSVMSARHNRNLNRPAYLIEGGKHADEVYPGTFVFVNTEDAYAINDVYTEAFDRAGNAGRAPTYDAVYNVVYPTNTNALASELAVFDPDFQNIIKHNEQLYSGISSKTTGWAATGTMPQRIRFISNGDTFWIGQGNLASPIDGNEYLTLTVNSGKLTPVSEAPSSGVYFKIEGTQVITTGTREGFNSYLVRALGLSTHGM